MEQVMELIELVVENWELIAAIASIAFSAGTMLRKRKWAKAARAFAYLGHVAFSAIEEAGEEFQVNRNLPGEKVAEIYTHPSGPIDHIKGKIEEAVGALEHGSTDMSDLIAEAENAIRMKVDPKENIPPIKRFWRRFLAGENFAGVAARMAARAAAGKVVEEVKERMD